MRTARHLVASSIALLLFSGLGLASDRWLHVRVEEDRGENVNVNIPLSMVEAMLPHIEMDELRNGKLMLDDHDLDELDGLDLPGILAALRDAPDADFVTVRSRHEQVRVAKEGRLLLIDVDEGDDERGERVRVRIPMAVVEALVGDGNGELDLMKALDALADYDGEDLVRVESDHESVRVWIDSNQSGD